LLEQLFLKVTQLFNLKPIDAKNIYENVSEEKIFNSLKTVPFEQSLANTHPELCSYWHPNRNLPLMPQDVTKGMRLMVWWQCKQGHEWRREIKARTRNKASGCRQCFLSTPRSKFN
jgi:hypothetical protein